jgi:hypothetical protein
MHNSHFVPNFLCIIWTRPIYNVPLSTPWKTEVRVLLLDGLPLLCFLIALVVEENLVEFLDTQKNIHIRS